MREERRLLEVCLLTPLTPTQSHTNVITGFWARTRHKQYLSASEAHPHMNNPHRWAFRKPGEIGGTLPKGPTLVKLATIKT